MVNSAHSRDAMLLLSGCGVTIVIISTALALRRSHAAEAREPSTALPSNKVIQAFPARGFDQKRLPNPGDVFDPKNYADRDTVWIVDWDVTNSQGGQSSVLKISAAHFGFLDRMQNRQWITVVRDLELGEIFVPYDPGHPQYEDIEGIFGFRIRSADRSLLGPPCLADGEILESDRPGMNGLVCKEVHDDGVRLIDNRSPTDRGRRGEKLILWVNFDGANYRYLMEYGFSDDGVISCRVGATAQNLINRQPAPECEDTHLHVGCWMFDPDLGDPTDPNDGGPDKNIVNIVRRVPKLAGVPDGTFRIDVSPFPGDGSTGGTVAGSALWNPEQFTTLRIQSTIRRNHSGQPHLSAYDLIAVRVGSCRAFPTPRFDYANRDFWVTPADESFNQFRNVPTYVKQQPGPLAGKRIRIWHNSPLLHVARGEDFGTDGVSRSVGSALVSWAGFMLKPRDLFDGTPLLPIDTGSKDTK